MTRQRVPAETAPKPKTPRRKGTRRTTPSLETLTELGPERLAGLILAETARNAAFRKLVSAALAARQGPDAVAAMIDRRLSALEGARGFIDWQKRRAFAADLDATVSVIVRELHPLDAEGALDRLIRFLEGADRVLDRVDDASGAIQGVYDRAGEAAAGIVAALPPETAAGVIGRLLPRLAAAPFGPFGSLIQDLLPRLDGPVLAALDAGLAAALAKPAQARDAFGRTALLRLRQDIADRQGDADAFLALETRIAPGRPDRAAIAQRLLDAGRAAEALEWLRRPEAPGRRPPTRADLIVGFREDGTSLASAGEAVDLEIRALESLGRADEAQDLRWSRFAQGLDAAMLRAYLAKLPDFEDDEALRRALTLAETHADAHRGLAFLAAWPDFGRAARLVLERRETWDGSRYGALAPAADALAEAHPQAAAILYRRLLDTILSTGNSAAYRHGARYLRALDDLAERLPIGALDPEPAAYREDLRRRHGRKYAFWGLFADAAAPT